MSRRRNHPIPVSVGAHDALQTRLEAVVAWLPKAAQFPEADIEHVHQLRVSTRKAGAALKLFRELLPKKRAKRLNVSLKGIRRAAGEARDLDVLLERLAVRAESDRSLVPLVEHLTRGRVAAQGPLIEVWRATADGSLAAAVSELLERVRWRGKPPEPPLSAAAAGWLAPIVRDFFDKAPAKGRRASIDQLHRFRIASKELRYALDLLAAAWPAEDYAKAAKLVRRLQVRLGKLNDHHAAIVRYETWLSEYAAAEKNAAGQGEDTTENEAPLRQAIEAEIAQEQKQLRRVVKRFRKWWTPDRRNRLRNKLTRLLDTAS